MDASGKRPRIIRAYIRRGRGYISVETRTVMKFAGGRSVSKTDGKEKDERKKGGERERERNK